MIINRLLYTWMLLIVCLNVSAQGTEDNIHIEPFNTTSINKWRTDLYLSGSWHGYKDSNLWTANNNTGKDKSNCYLNFTELAIGVDLSKDHGLIFEGNVGYTYGSLAYTRALFPSSSVGSHWISFDVNVSHLAFLDGMMYGGIKSSLFAGSRINNNDNYSFEGFYDDCFNSATFIPYVGFRLRFQYIKLDLRVATQVVPYLNANKIAYHNMHKTYVDGLSVELRLGVKLFSTSNPFRHVNNLFSDL